MSNKAILCHILCRSHESLQCVFFGWWSSPRELRGSVVDIVAPPKLLQLLSSFYPFSDSSSRTQGSVLWLAASIHHSVRLWQSLSGDSHRLHQQALPGICNSVGVWQLYVGWIPRWGSLWMAFPSVSAPLFVPVFPLDRRHSELKFADGCVAPSLNP